jgi:hypothetical protein
LRGLEKDLGTGLEIEGTQRGAGAMCMGIDMVGGESLREGEGRREEEATGNAGSGAGGGGYEGTGLRRMEHATRLEEVGEEAIELGNGGTGGAEGGVVKIEFESKG